MNWEQNYQGLLSKRDALMQEIEKTERNIERLKKTDKKYDRLEMDEREKALTAGYADMLYFRMPARYINTVFFKHREELTKRNHVCLDMNFLNKTFLSDTVSVHIAVFCEKVEDTMAGPVLHLFEPYRSFKSHPLGISYEDALAYEGHLLFVTARIPSAGRIGKEEAFKIDSVKNTGLGLYGPLDGGNDPSTSCDAVSTELYRMIGMENEPVPEKEVASVMTGISNSIMSDNRFSRSVEINRISDRELRFIYNSDEPNVHFVLYSVSYEDGDLYIRRENWHAGTGFNYGLWEMHNPGKKPVGWIEKWAGDFNQPEYKWRFCAETAETDEFNRYFEQKKPTST